jgi:hypothetical protein
VASRPARASRTKAAKSGGKGVIRLEYGVSETYWQPGDIVVMRYVETPTSARMVHTIMGDPAHVNGEPFLSNGEMVTVQARPYRVIADSDEVVALFMPEGTVTQRWHIAERRYMDSTAVSRVDTLRLLFPGAPYDVTLFFEAEGEPPWHLDGLFEGEGLQEGWRERRRAEGEDVFRLPPRPVEPGRFRGWYVNVQTPFDRQPYGFDVADMTLDVVVRPDRSWYWKDTDELRDALAAGACSEAQAEQIWEAGRQVVRLVESGSAPFDESWRRWQPLPREAITEVPDGWQTAATKAPDWPVVS